jgi:hypothetical protein
LSYSIVSDASPKQSTQKVVILHCYLTRHRPLCVCVRACVRACWT